MQSSLLRQRLVYVAAEYPSSAGDGVPGFLVDVVAQGGGKRVQGAVDRPDDLVRQRPHPVRNFGLIGHVRQSFLDRVQRHAQPVDIVLTEAAHDGAGELRFDGAATLPRPVELPAQCLSGTFGRRAVPGRVQRVDNGRYGVRGTPGERLHR